MEAQVLATLNGKLPCLATVKGQGLTEGAAILMLEGRGRTSEEGFVWQAAHARILADIASERLEPPRASFEGDITVWPAIWCDARGKGAIAVCEGAREALANGYPRAEAKRWDASRTKGVKRRNVNQPIELQEEWRLP